MNARRALVTGASKGIGRAIALRLGQHGWSVAVHYRGDAAGAQETLAGLGQYASGVYQANLEEPESAANLLASVEGDGPLYALVNNAGIYEPIQVLDVEDEVLEANLRRMMAVNLFAPIRLTRLAARAFRERGGGKVLNVASRVGFKGEAGAATYAASKAALINVTRSLAIEWAPFNVGLFGIAPGWVETAMVRDGMADRLAEVVASIPLSRMASPEDCAAAAAFLLSDGAAYLSGQVIDINGASYFH
jgi:3-oxoacyl-[acyl-carrier protein] reductase